MAKANKRSNVPAAFADCVVLSLFFFTSSHCAETWADSAAARLFLVARPSLSAASFCCVPVCQSPPQPRPSASSGPSDADSTAGEHGPRSKRRWVFWTREDERVPHTWSFWSCMVWCSSSTCIITSLTFLSSLRLDSCRLARSLKDTSDILRFNCMFFSQFCHKDYVNGACNTRHFNYEEEQNEDLDVEEHEEGKKKHAAFTLKERRGQTV